MKKIVIDPGHGGSDPGATKNKHYEKNFTLSIALAASKYLKDNFTSSVYLTRTTDITVNLSERSSYANNLKADLFVSIHINAGGGTGFESFIYTGAGSVTQQLQQTLHSVLAGYYNSLGFPNRGIKRANFSVLRNTAMSAILLENLFIDRSSDLAQLTKKGFPEALGAKIGSGIAKALLLPQGSTQPPQDNPDSPPEQTLVWDPQAEIERLKQDRLIFSDYSPNDPVNWGQFATVLNRIRDL